MTNENLEIRLMEDGVVAENEKRDLQNTKQESRQLSHSLH